MFSHVCVGSADLDRAARFYDAVLFELGLVQRTVVPDGGPQAVCWAAPGQPLPRFYVYLPLNGQPATAGNGSMVAFLAASPSAVSLAHAAGLAHGGRDEGAAGPRSRYGDGYFGAYLRDPDGNKLHLAFRGDLELAP